MPDNLLPKIQTKIDRAKANIGNLEKEVRVFFHKNQYTVVSDLNFDGSERIWRFRLNNRNLDEISVSAAGILQLLRESLDNLMCEMAFQNKGTRSDTYFPFGKSIEIFESQIAGKHSKTKHLPPDAIALIRAARPYKGGDNLLWALHDLNRVEKHLGLNVIQMNGDAFISELVVNRGMPLILGSRYGRHLLVGDYRPKFLAVVAKSEDVEFLTTTPDAEFHTNAKPVFAISFRDIDGFEEESIVAVLRQILDLVQGLFLTFKNQFFP